MASAPRAAVVTAEDQGPAVRSVAKTSAALTRVSGVTTTGLARQIRHAARQRLIAASRLATSRAALICRRRATAQNCQVRGRSARPEVADFPTNA